MNPGPRRPVRVFMVDDHPAVRQGLRLLLEQEGVVICGEAGGVVSARESVPGARPDLVLVDLSLGKESGLTLLKELAALCPGVPRLVYSMHEDSFHVGQALAAGAAGYVTKREMASVLTRAIEEVLAGRRFLSPRVEELQGAGPEPGHAGDPLSPRELLVFRLLGEGYSPAAIADHLAVSRRTVDSYFARIQEKLGLRGMEELRLRAVVSRSGE